MTIDEGRDVFHQFKAATTTASQMEDVNRMMLAVYPMSMRRSVPSPRLG